MQHVTMSGMGTPEENAEILALLKENRALAAENHKLLQKLYRHSVAGFVLRIVWYLLILVGLPIAIYIAMQPYLAALGANYETFQSGVFEVSGLKGFEQFLPFLHTMK